MKEKLYVILEIVVTPEHMWVDVLRNQYTYEDALNKLAKRKETLEQTLMLSNLNFTELEKDTEGIWIMGSEEWCNSDKNHISPLPHIWLEIVGV